MPSQPEKTIPEVGILMSRGSIRRPKHLGGKLKQIRENWFAGPLTQEELANLLKKCLFEQFGEEFEEFNREYVSGFERGTRSIPLVLLLAYAHLANLYVEVLIDDRLMIEPAQKIPFLEKYSGLAR